MLKDFNVVRYPELIVGLAGPIGVDIEAITESVENNFRNLGYFPITIKITEEIDSLESGIKRPKNKRYYEKMKFKMQHASELCRDEDDAAYLMRIAIAAIRRERANIIEQGGGLIDEDRFEELKRKKENGEISDHTLGAAFYFSENQQNVASRVVYIVGNYILDVTDGKCDLMSGQAGVLEEIVLTEDLLLLGLDAVDPLDVLDYCQKLELSITAILNHLGYTVKGVEY